jgi:glutaredoxin-related protein
VDVPVTVRGVVEQPQVGFSQSIRPILNKAGCALAAITLLADEDLV